ncbi:nuclear transport factor 2 family protein [Streptomyces sp. NPDC050264]|uniref:nuclear transport factor 2 family protein n=1 Tax=Streptomyces sp. NPDC050264 TaxID=3155038 RepID=UPI003428A4A2
MSERDSRPEWTEEAVTAQIQSAIAAYAHALDAGDLDGIVDLFWPDAVAEIAGVGEFEGLEAIRQAYAGFAPTGPQLHMVANTVVTRNDGREATAVSDLAFMQRGESGWAVQLVGRYDDTLLRRGDEWRFARRVTTFRG